jgi:hypothetical protein
MRYHFVVLTNATDGQDQAYNDWYNEVHLPDVLSVPGFVAAQRFKLSQEGPPQDFTHGYLAIYEVETDDLEGAHRALQAASGTDAMVISPALDRDSAVAVYFEAITDRREAPASRPADTSV